MQLVQFLAPHTQVLKAKNGLVMPESHINIQGTHLTTKCCLYSRMVAILKIFLIMIRFWTRVRLILHELQEYFGTCMFLIYIFLSKNWHSILHHLFLEREPATSNTRRYGTG